MPRIEVNQSFQLNVYNDLEEMPNRVTFPDRTNKGKALATLMMWKRVSDLADKKYEALKGELIEHGLLKDPTTITTPGTFVIAEAGPISVEVNVTHPRREFNIDWFCDALEKKYRIPSATTRTLMEEAKRPGTTQSRRLTIKEKGVNI